MTGTDGSPRYGNIAIVAAALVVLVLAACRGGGATPRDVQVPVLTPTPSPLVCLNDDYPDTAPVFGNDADIAYKGEEDGTQIFDRVIGGGKTPTEGSAVEMRYTAFLTDGCIFDTTYEEGEPIVFALDNLLVGWQLGMLDMRTGGARRIRIPPALAFGVRGAPIFGIPANATIILEVELLSFTEPETP